MPLSAGARLGPYEILSAIGAGGMGEVYKARDTRLDRDVAVKVLPAEFAADSDPSTGSGPSRGKLRDERLTRFEREAKATAALSHPKLVEGVLDGEAETITHAPIGTTALGRVLGTVAYMAPEQARGRPVDARADLFFFGVVLYEMLAGDRPFRGETATDTVAAILMADPAPLPARVPPGLQRIVTQCLAKRPEQRFSSAHDLALALQAVSRPSEVVSVGVTGTRATSPTRRWRVLVGSALLPVALAGGAWFGLRSHPGLRVFGWSLTPAKLTDKGTIVVADFDNKTGDGDFDDTLKQGLSVALEQSPFLALLSDRRVNDTLKLMGRPAGDRLTPAVTQQVCERTGTTAMLTGSIASLGSQYVIGLKAVACKTGDVLAEAQEQAADKETVLKKALDAAAVSLRKQLGESLSSVERFDTPLEDATTRSTEAWRAYCLAVKTDQATGETAALPFFERAVALDPSFAMAYARMSSDYTNLNEVGRAADNARRAYELREKVSEPERFFIEAIYFLNATGELEGVAKTARQWQQTYPRDALPHIMLGYVSPAVGHWEDALEEFQAALRLDPDIAGNYLNLGQTYAALDRLDEAEAVYKQAEARKLEGELVLLGRYWLAFLKGDAAAMAQRLSAAMGKPGCEDLLLASQADTEGWYGRLKHAHEMTMQAMESAQRNNATESAAAYQAAAALRDVEAGNRDQARAEARAALDVAPNRDIRAMAALALARAGETAVAGTLAAELEKTSQLDTLVRTYWLPTIRAAVALQRKEPDRAVDLLKVASTIELSWLKGNHAIFICPGYVRGEAYLMLHDGQAAALEFQKFKDHRGLVMNFPWGALARLGLARAYTLQRDTMKARAAYQEFLTIWKDADSDLPILRAAKAEYARLQ